MKKINKHAIETLTINDKQELTHMVYSPAKKKTFFSKGKPETWKAMFCDPETEADIDKAELCVVVDSKVYVRANFVIQLISGEEIIHRFDTYEEAEVFAYEYIKKNNLIDFINKY